MTVSFRQGTVPIVRYKMIPKIETWDASLNVYETILKKIIGETRWWSVGY